MERTLERRSMRRRSLQWYERNLDHREWWVIPLLIGCILLVDRIWR